MTDKPVFYEATFGSEDEDNNFFIDMYLMQKEWSKPKIIKPVFAIFPESSITITITKEDHVSDPKDSKKEV